MDIDIGDWEIVRACPIEKKLDNLCPKLLHFLMRQYANTPMRQYTNALMRQCADNLLN
jgi:hypothetical protein